MRRFAPICSVLFLFAVAGMWVRGVWINERIEWRGEYLDDQGRNRCAYIVDLGGGQCGIGYEWILERSNQHLTNLTGMFYGPYTFVWPRKTVLNIMGFAWHVGGGSGSGTQYRSLNRYWAVAVPYWSIFLLGSVLPLRMGYLRYRRYQRRRELRCVTCGYDMRATPARCPECGMEGGMRRGRS